MISPTAFLLVHSFIFCAGIKVSGLEIQFQVTIEPDKRDESAMSLIKSNGAQEYLQSGAIFSSGKWSGILDDHHNPFTSGFLSNPPLSDFRKVVVDHANATVCRI